MLTLEALEKNPPISFWGSWQSLAFFGSQVPLKWLVLVEPQEY